MLPKRIPSFLSSIIYKNYLTASLIPVFTIEIVLLIMYFGLNWYLTDNNKKTLLDEVKENIPHICGKEAGKINGQLEHIAMNAKILQAENQRFFEDPAKFLIPNEEPQFLTSTNGVYYKKNNNGCSLYYSALTKITKKEADKARNTECFDPLYKLMVEVNPLITQVYFNSFDGMNRLFPFINKVYEQYPPDLLMQDYNFYYLADNKHNPARKPMWTGAYLDPAGQGWMISCVVPIYNNNFLEGVTGIDVTIEKFVQNVLNLDLPWKASAFLTDNEGTILAMPETVEKILGLTELKNHVYDSQVRVEVLKPKEFNLKNNINQDIATSFKKILSSGSHLSNLKIRNKNYLIVQTMIPETTWRLMVLVDEDVVFSRIYALNHLAHEIGYIIIFIMFIFYLVFFLALLKRSNNLSQRISSPIEKLAKATEKIGTVWHVSQLELSGIIEIDNLSKNFNHMSEELDKRTQDLVDAQIREKIKEKDAEIAYSTGLFESANAYMHSIGNSLSGVDGKISRIKKVLDSTSNYPLVFKNIKDSLSQNDKEKTTRLLDRLEMIIIKNVIPIIGENFEKTVEIHKQMVNSIKHQQEMYKTNKSHMDRHIQRIDIYNTFENIFEDFNKDLIKNNIIVIKEFDNDVFVYNKKFQFIHHLTNMIKNSIEAIKANILKKQGEIKVTLKNKELEDKKNQKNRVIITLEDNGIGVNPDDLPKIFSAGFTTKENGHGLALHSFVNFLNENNGKVKVISPGIFQGCQFIVEIGDVQQQNINS